MQDERISQCRIEQEVLAFLRSLGRVEQRKQAFSISRGGNVTLDKQVHETRNGGDHVRAEIFFVGEKAFVCGVIPELSNGVPQGAFVVCKAKAVNTFAQVSSLTAQVLNQAFKGDTEQCASRPRRCRRNRLGLFEGNTNRFGHVLSRLKTAVNRPNGLLVDRKDKAFAVRTSKNACNFNGIGLKQIRGCDLHFWVEDGPVDETADVDRRFFPKNYGEHVEQANNATVRATR